MKRDLSDLMINFWMWIPGNRLYIKKRDESRRYRIVRDLVTQL